MALEDGGQAVTDRIKGLVVTLDKDMRADDTEGIVKAISNIRGVSDVSEMVADPDHYIAVARARQELREKMIDILWPKEKP